VIGGIVTLGAGELLAVLSVDRKHPYVIFPVFGPLAGLHDEGGMCMSGRGTARLLAIPLQLVGIAVLTYGLLDTTTRAPASQPRTFSITLAF
jgi:hypothetical protein